MKVKPICCSFCQYQLLGMSELTLCHLVASEWVVVYVLLSTVWVSVDVRFSCTVSLAKEDAEIAICVLV